MEPFNPDIKTGTELGRVSASQSLCEGGDWGWVSQEMPDAHQLPKPSA